MKPSAQEKKWISAIKKSGRFDRDFYQHWYGDDSNVGRNLEQHYILTGEMRGYWPSREFCPELYLDANPDVLEAGVPPFFHYVTSGEKEDRLLRPQAQYWNDEDDEMKFSTIDLSAAPVSKARYAIVVHVYHYGMWPSIAEKIDSLEIEYDLYVTVTYRGDQDFNELSVTIKSIFSGAVVWLVPNRGRDILPFFQLVNGGVLSAYQAVCKIHTKKSPHLKSGQAWGEHLLTSLLPRAEATRELLKQFSNAAECGILTATGQKKSGRQWWYGNRGRALNLLARAGVITDPDQLCFPAGSMYWIKPQVLQALGRLQLSAEDFEPELGQGDGTTAHALERVVGCLAGNEGMKIEEIAKQPLAKENHQNYDFCESDDSCFSVSRDFSSEEKMKPRRPAVSRNVHYEGVLECCSLRGVVGWIRELSDREIACRLLLTIDGVTVTEGFADQYRFDLGERDDVSAYCGFILPVPDCFFDGGIHGFQVSVLGDAWLYRSLRFQTRLTRIEEMGAVTEISRDEVIGWCHDPFDQKFKQEVDLLIDGYFAGGSEAAEGSDGGNGFRLEIPPSFRDGEAHDIKVVVRGSRICLADKGI